jgi:hypothetical protein
LKDVFYSRVAGKLAILEEEEEEKEELQTSHRCKNII